MGETAVGSVRRLAYRVVMIGASVSIAGFVEAVSRFTPSVAVADLRIEPASERRLVNARMTIVVPTAPITAVRAPRRAGGSSIEEAFAGAAKGRDLFARE
jgi:hypothetical protein